MYVEIVVLAEAALSNNREGRLPTVTLSLSHGGVSGVSFTVDSTAATLAKQCTRYVSIQNSDDMR